MVLDNQSVYTGPYAPFVAAAAGTSTQSQQIVNSGDTYYLTVQLENGGPVSRHTVNELENVVQRIIDKNGRRSDILRRTGR